MASDPPFPVLCDRCRAEGLAGEAEFAELAGLGDLLDFEPVPRRVARADGWTPEIQRAYVAALAVTGSERQAAHAVGRAQFGVAQLRRAEGNESFLAACDKALEIWRERERVRRSDTLLAAAHGEAARTRGRPHLAWSGAATRHLPPPPPGEPAESRDAEARERANRHFILTLLKKHDVKLAQERQARLEGRIVEADFYLRQITWLEVAIDLGTGDGFAVFADLRAGKYNLVDVVETPMSRMFAVARRARWQEAGELDRPECPTRERLRDHGRFTTQDGESWSSGADPQSHAEWHQDRIAEHEAAARAQAEWEEKSHKESEARRDYERRRDSDAANNQEPGEAGQPAPGGRQDRRHEAAFVTTPASRAASERIAAITASSTECGSTSCSKNSSSFAANAAKSGAPASITPLTAPPNASTRSS